MVKRVIKNSFFVILLFEGYFIMTMWGLFNNYPIMFLSITLAFSILFCLGFIIPLEIELTMKKNIKNEIGTYYVIKYLNGLSTVYSMNGELLVLSDDNNFYRIIIESAKIRNVSLLDSHITKTLI